MRNASSILCSVLGGLLLIATESAPTAAQETLPDDIDQLIQMKTDLLEQYTALRESGPADKAIEVLAQIVNIHRKAFNVAKATERSQDDIVKLRNVFTEDGEFLSDQFFSRAQYAESAALRNELEELYTVVLGPDHNATQDIHWKAVTADKLAAASKESQVAYQVAIGNASQADQALQNGQPAVAERLLNQLIAAEVAVSGEDHTDVAIHLNDLGRAQLMATDYDAAEKTFLRSLKIREATTGKDLRYATTAFNLGRVCQDTQRFDEAEKHYLTAAAIEEPILGSADESFQQTLAQLEFLYQQTGNAEKLTAIQQRIASADPVNTVTSHMPRGTFAAALIEPSTLSTDPGLELLPFEVIRATGEEELGFNPLNVDAAVVFATLPLNDSPDFGVSFRLRDGATASFPWSDESESVEFNGEQYQRQASGGPRPLCVKEFNDGVIVVGTEEAIRQCISNAAETAVATMLKADRGRGQLVSAADLVVMRPFIQAAMAQVPPAPPAVENLKTVPDLVDSVQVRLDVSGGVNLSLTMNTPDEAAAQHTAAALAQALEFGLQAGLQQMETDISGDGPVEVATRQYVERIATRYLNRLQPSVDGTAVNLDIDGIEHAYGPVVVALLLPAVQAARDAAQQAREEAH